jgi:hypothetical protein
MRKLIAAAAVLVTAFAMLQRFGPRLKERAMRKCEEMFDHMPDAFPPKRMMRGIDEVREQNVEILRHLRDRARV